MTKLMTLAGVSTSLILGLAGANASAEALSLIKALEDDKSYTVTLKVGSLADLEGLLVEKALDFSELPDMTVGVIGLGLSFKFSGSWGDHSPLMIGRTTSPRGFQNPPGETDDSSNRRFSIDFSYPELNQPTLGDGTELLSFRVAQLPGAWGRIELSGLTMTPMTNLTNAIEPSGVFVTFDALPVPEPSTYLMMAVGLAAFGLARRTRRC